MNEKEVKNIRLTDIIPNRFQPRLNFDDDGLTELSESIKQHGIIQPLVLRNIGNKYEIIAGERRYKASTLAGLQEVPAIIVNLNDEQSAEVALVENIQRRELSAIEEARSYRNILTLGGLKQDELAKRMGKNQSTVSNKLRLLNLCEEVQEALLKGQISERHARSLLSLKSVDKQKLMLARIINERLTVRKTDEEVAKMNTMDIEEDVIDIIEDVEELDSAPITKEEPQEYSNPFFSMPIENQPVESINQTNSPQSQPNKYFTFAEPENQPFVSQPVPQINETPTADYKVDNSYINLPINNEVAPEPFVKEEPQNISNPFVSNINVVAEQAPMQQPTQSVMPTPTQQPTPNSQEQSINFEGFMNTIPTYENKNQNGDIKNVEENNTNVDTSLSSRSKIDPDKFITIIKAFRELVDEIESYDYYVEGEESDFPDYYQFVIKVDKERL